MWGIFIAVMLAGLIVQQVLNSKFDKYSKIPAPSGMSGAQIAERMLASHGINDVKVCCIPGKLTDHFDPTTKTVNLSEGVYGSNSIAAAAVAAHECGHAVQHAQGYAPLKLRSALVPVVSFTSRTVQWILLLGMLIINITPSLLYLGIAMFAMSTLFSLVTLPVEINASMRATSWLESSRMTTYETYPMACDALKWAAYTYVIAAISSLATLLYYIGLARRN